MSEIFHGVGTYREQEDQVSVAHRWYHCGNLDTRKGRRFNAILILTVALLPVCVTVVQNVINFYTNSVYVNRILELRSRILFSTETGNIVHRTQIERGTTALYISSRGDTEVFQACWKRVVPWYNSLPTSCMQTDIALMTARNNTDNAILSISQWPEEAEPHFENRTAFHVHIKDFRHAVNPASTSVNDVITFYSNANKIMLKWVADSIQLYDSGSLWKTLVSYHMLILSKEQTGIERALGGTFFATGIFTQDQLLQYMLTKTQAETYLIRSMEYDQLPQQFFNENFTGSALDRTINDMRNRISHNNDSQPSVQEGKQWFENMTAFINLMLYIEDELEKKILLDLNSEIRELEDGLTRMIGVMVFSFLLSPFVFFCIKRLIFRMQHYALSLSEKTRDLDKERKRSQNILYELLPVPVAKKMIACEPVEPESYSQATIFFSDIVGFTTISSRSSPMQVVTMLNMLYQAFDNKLEIYDVYKVETIGDAYMVASGLPVRNGRKHAPEIAGLALDLLDTIANLRIPHIPDESLRLRIGLNSGPVVAGVVGHKMPRYCLFGDTVNTASRMESSSLPHHIQITESTQKCLLAEGGFYIKPRGLIDVKGKGLMSTYWLTGRDQTPLICTPRHIVM